MFLRANVRRAGLANRGEPSQASYAAAFRDDAMIGVAAHCWNGMVLLQAPAQAAALATASVEWSGRPVTGLAGPVDQVALARSALGVADRMAAVDGDEWLYALDLQDLIVPALSTTTIASETSARHEPARRKIVCRAPRREEVGTLREWRLAYDIETLGATDSVEIRRRSADMLDTQIAEDCVWVAVADDTLLSLSAFNASLPDIVQLGGIYTPPALRGRGYAKVAVAASLVAARQRGASRAILFTKNPNAARTYEAVGFRRTGSYALVLF
jgi:GNAT superfamily N-acetyltransferase